jgi:phenylacetic acid degradation operon negative regulatory protein
VSTEKPSATVAQVSQTSWEPTPFVSSAVALRPQELVISLVGEYVEPGGRVWSGGLVQLLDCLGFSAPGARVALNRLVSRGLFDVVKDGRKVFYAASARLVELLSEGHQQTFWFRYSQEPWRGDWTLVWYTIPEEQLLKRRRLSRRLVFLGFGALQDGTWLAPRDRSEELWTAVEDLRLREFVVVVVGAAPAWASRQTMIRRAWNIEDASARYTAIVDGFRQFANRRVLAAVTPERAFIVRTHLIEAIRQVAPLDPKLPDAETGFRWHRRLALEVFEDVDAALRPMASEFFNEKAQPHSDG